MYFQKLLQIPFTIYFINLIFSLIKIFGFSLICIGIGLIILKILKVPRLSTLSFGVTALIIGEVLLSFLFLFVFTTVSLTYTNTYILLIILFLIGIVPLWKFTKTFKPTYLIGKITKQQTGMLILSISIILISLLLSSARLGYDAVSDYFSQAKLMAVTQEITSFFPENYMIVSSLHPDILFTVLIQIGGDQSARMLSWLNGMAIMFSGYAISKEAGLATKARYYFFVLMLTSTAFIDLLGDGKVELICTAPILVLSYWMLVSLRKPSKGIFLLIGFLAGFAIISRLYNIFLVSLFIILFYFFSILKELYIEWLEKRNFNSRIGSPLILNLFWMLPTLLIVGGFHLWQNWLWLDSPFAPLEFAEKLKASNWEWQFDPATLNLLRILYPFTVTFFNNPQSLGNISPIVVGFLPFLMFKDIRMHLRVTHHAFVLISTSILILIVWLVFFYTVVEVRYVLFIWVLLFIPIAKAFEFSLNHLPKFFSAQIQFFVNILLLYIILRIGVISTATYSPIASNGQAFCSDLSYCDFFEPVNHIANPNDRILALHAYRYYLRPDLFACSSRANEYSALKKFAKENSPDFWVESYRQGYRFIIYEENFAKYHSRFGSIPNPSLAPDWLTVTLISSSANNKNKVYRIDVKDPPFQPEIKCEKDEEQNSWYLVFLDK